MDLLPKPVDFAEAIKAAQAKKVLPTNLTSADLKKLGADFLRQSFFSAQTTHQILLERYKDVVLDITKPRTEQRADRITADNPLGNVTVGANPATARAKIKDMLASIGYQAKPGEEGTIKDLSSDHRINLVVKTNVAMAQGAGHKVQQNLNPDVVEAFPALELLRTGEAKGGPDAERDWGERWEAAAEEAGDDDALKVYKETGRMVALLSSGIWQALGDGAGGYDDTLGNDFDPIAFNTHMRRFPVDREETESLGLLDPGEESKPATIDFAKLFAIKGES